MLRWFPLASFQQLSFYWNANGRMAWNPRLVDLHPRRRGRCIGSLLVSGHTVNDSVLSPIAKHPPHLFGVAKRSCWLPGLLHQTSTSTSCHRHVTVLIVASCTAIAIMGDVSITFSLRYQARCLKAVTADKFSSKWVVGTNSLREENEVRLSLNLSPHYLPLLPSQSVHTVSWSTQTRPSDILWWCFHAASCSSIWSRPRKTGQCHHICTQSRNLGHSYIRN